MKKHSEYLDNRRVEVLKNGSLQPDMLDFYIRLYALQEKFISETGDLSQYKKFFRDGIFPLLDPEMIRLDEETLSSLSKLLIELADIITGMNRGLDFSHLVKSFKNDAGMLLSSLLRQDYSLLEKKGIENRLGFDEFIFIIHNVFKPLMSSMRESSGLVTPRDEWMENTCSFCGYLPDMSKIVESKENQRHLHCALCENEWEFPRLICPACGCTDQKKHGFFEFEDNSLYRVYYCEECKSYIKNVRIPRLQEESRFDLTVEDVITNFLDAAMIEKGYKRI